MTENIHRNKIVIITHQENGHMTCEVNFIVNNECVFTHMPSCITDIKSSFYAYFDKINKKDLSNFIFYNLGLVTCDFSYVDLTNTIFNNCDLANSNFSHANLTNTRLHSSNLYCVNLNNAIIKNTSMLTKNRILIHTDIDHLD